MSKKLHLSSFDPTNYVLIARNSAGEKVGSMGSRGDVEYAKGLAYSMLRVDRSGSYASVDIYPYSAGSTPWEELDALISVTLDDEGVEE